MNIETFYYSLFATVLGMAVVFFFLAFLSFLMCVLKHLFRERDHEKAERAVPEEIGEEKKPSWLIAAVTAYLTLEEEETISAQAWKSSKIDLRGSWRIGGKYLNR